MTVLLSHFLGQLTTNTIISKSKEIYICSKFHAGYFSGPFQDVFDLRPYHLSFSLGNAINLVHHFFATAQIFFLPLIWLCQEKTQIWFHPEKLGSVSQKSIAVTGSLHPPWPWSTSSRECTPAATLLPQRSQSEALNLQDEYTDFECGWMNTNSQFHSIPVHTFEHTPVL